MIRVVVNLDRIFLHCSLYDAFRSSRRKASGRIWYSEKYVPKRIVDAL